MNERCADFHTELIGVPVLPMLAKRLLFKFHSLYDTMRLPEKRAACFAFLHDEVASGALRPIIDRTFPLEQIADAPRYMETNAQRGEIVVTT